MGVTVFLTLLLGSTKPWWHAVLSDMSVESQEKRDLDHVEHGIGCWKESTSLLKVVCMLVPFSRTTRRPISFPRSDFAKAGRRESLGTWSPRAKINYS